MSSPPRVTEHTFAPSLEAAVYPSHTTNIDWQPAILTEHGAVVELPEHGVCLGADSAWLDASSDAAPISNTSLERHAFRAKGHINLRKGVRTVYIDTGVRTMGIDAQLHVVSGPVDHAILDVEAFYDKTGSLSPIYACAYQADWTRKAWLNSLPNPDDMEVYYETEEEEELLSYEELIALRISQIPTEPEPGELQDIDLFRLQRNNVDSMGSEAPVWFNITLTIPVDDKSYKVKVDIGGVFDVDVHDDVELESLKVFSFGGSNDQATLTKGRVVAEDGFSAHRIEVMAHEVSGHFRSDGYVRMHSGGPMDVLIDAVRAPGQSPPSLLLTTYKSALNASVRLVDAEPERPGFFDISGFAKGGPLNITLVEGGPSSAVTLKADTEDGDARVKLDKRFEGYLDARVLEPSESTEVRICLESKKQDEWDVEDPTGEGRKRYLVFTDVEPHEMTGEVAWGEKTWGMPGEGWSGASNAMVKSVRGSAYIEI